MLARRGVTQVLFDKDRGLEILVRALGGEYQPLKSGEPTGFNPLQLAPTPRNVEFLKDMAAAARARRIAAVDARAERSRAGVARNARPRACTRGDSHGSSSSPMPRAAKASMRVWRAGVTARAGDYAWVFD